MFPHDTVREQCEAQGSAATKFIFCFLFRYTHKKGAIKAAMGSPTISQTSAPGEITLTIGSGPVMDCDH